MTKRLFCFFLVALLSACNTDIRIGNSLDFERLTFDFNNGAQGWQAGFSDFDSENADGFNLQADVRQIPGSDGKTGFYLAGTNQSDDLFMYIKSRFGGLRASARYIANIEVDFISNAGAGCVGIGGSPGESVYMKFGNAETEPAQAGYFLNVAKGNQSNNGTNANVIGNIGVDGLACDGQQIAAKSLRSTGSTQLEFTTTSDGRVWFFVGTDSGFEGRTELYFERIEITVILKQ